MDRLSDRTKQYLFHALPILIVAVAAFLRLYHLDLYPTQINQDELSNVYDGYSISETGADRWGVQHPIILKAFGNSDYRPPLYAWLAALSIKAFGYSIFSGRLPSALLGIAGLVLLYLAAKKIKGRLFALLALLFASFIPWHIIYSRLAHEGTTLPSFFVILSLFLWIRTKEYHYRYRDLLLLGFTAGFATNAYQSSKLTFLLFSMIVVVELLRNTTPFLKKAFAFVVAVGLGAAPQLIAAFTMPEHFFSRANGTAMKYTSFCSYFSELIRNLFVHLSPDYLFFNYTQNIGMTVGKLLTMECVFFYTGLLLCSKVFKDSKLFRPWQLYTLLFITILPAALTMPNPHFLRASGSVLLMPLISATGVLYFYEKIKKERFRKLFAAGVMLLAIINGMGVAVLYKLGADAKNPERKSSIVQVCLKLNEYKQTESRVLLEDVWNQPYVYVAAYTMTPQEFQKAEKVYTNGVWTYFHKLGKYRFLSGDEIKEEGKLINGKALIIAKEKMASWIVIDSVQDEGDKLFLMRNY